MSEVNWKLPTAKSEWQETLDNFLDSLNNDQRNYILFKLRAAAAAGKSRPRPSRRKGAPPTRMGSTGLTPIRESGGHGATGVSQRKASVFDALLSSPKRAASSPGLRQSHRNSTVGFFKQAFGISSSPAMGEADTSDVFCVKTMLEAALVRDAEAKYHLPVCVADEQHVLTTESLTHSTTARELVASLLTKRDPPLEANHGLRLFKRNVLKSTGDPLARIVVVEELDLDATVMDVAAGFEQAKVDKGRAGFLIALDLTVYDPEFDCALAEMKAANLHFVYTQLRADVRAGRAVADLATMVKLSAIALSIDKGISNRGINYHSTELQREIFGETFDDRRWYKGESISKLGEKIKAAHASVSEQLVLTGAGDESIKLQRLYLHELAQAGVPYLAVWKASKWKMKSDSEESAFHDVQIGIDRSGIHIVDVVNKVSESFPYTKISSMGMSDTSEIFLFTVGKKKNFLLSSEYERINELVSLHIDNIKKGAYKKRTVKMTKDKDRGGNASTAVGEATSSPATGTASGTASRRRRASRRRVSLTNLIANASSSKSAGSLRSAAAAAAGNNSPVKVSLDTLPPGWKRAEHEGRTYYYNKKLGKSVWKLSDIKSD